MNSTRAKSLSIISYTLIEQKWTSIFSSYLVHIVVTVAKSCDGFN